MNEYLRYMKSKKRVEKSKLQERAMMDWFLADLIGKSIRRLYSNSAKLPEFQDYYSVFFNEEQKEDIEQKKQERKDELSALRFKQFAHSHNQNFKEV